MADELTNVVASNGLIIPFISIQSLDDFAYMLYDGNCDSFSKKEKSEFTNDEYAFQAALSEIVTKLRSTVSSGVVGFMYPKHREKFLQNEIYEILMKNAENINIEKKGDKFEVSGLGSGFGFCLSYIILKTNGYQVEVNNTMKEAAFRGEYKAEISTCEPLDMISFEEEFRENFYATNYPDINFQELLDKGKAINARKQEEIRKQEKFVKETLELINSFKSQEGRDPIQQYRTLQEYFDSIDFNLYHFREKELAREAFAVYKDENEHDIYKKKTYARKRLNSIVKNV